MNLLHTFLACILAFSAHARGHASIDARLRAEGPCIIREERSLVYLNEKVSAEIEAVGNADFSSWERGPLNSTQFLAATKVHAETDIVKLVAVFNNTIFFPRAKNRAHRSVCTPTNLGCNG